MMNTTEPSIWFCYVGTKLKPAGWSWLRKELQDSGKMPIDKISLLNEDFAWFEYYTFGSRIKMSTFTVSVNEKLFNNAQLTVVSQYEHIT